MSTRIGMLTPSSNTVVEPTTMAMLADLQPQVTAHFSRLRVTAIGLEPDQLGQFEHHLLLEAARLLADAKVDVIAWNGTAGSWLGLDFDRDLCQRIEREVGIRATTATLAAVEAFRAFGVSRFGLVVPYTPEVVDRIKVTFRSQGLECAAEEHLGLQNNFDFAEVPSSQLAQMARSVAPRADAVAVLCTNLAGARLAPELEDELGIPVVDSVVATCWRCLDLAGFAAPLLGWGVLAASGSLRLRFQAILEELLQATDGSRTTIRLDLPAHGLSVDRVAGEARRPGVRSIRHDGSLDQWAMATVRWLDANHGTLVQNDVRVDPPPVTPALIDVYNVAAQMLGALVIDGRMLGWISVHEVGRPRAWTAAEKSALDRACREVVHIVRVSQLKSAEP